jgi:hypothetical protein
MTGRVRESRSTAAELPLTLLPIAVGADLVGRIVDSRPLRSLARQLMPIAIGSLTAAAARQFVDSALDSGRIAPERGPRARAVALAAATTATALATRMWRRSAPLSSLLVLGVGAVSLTASLALEGRTPGERRGRGSGGAVRAPFAARHPRLTAAVRTAAGDMLRGL